MNLLKKRLMLCLAVLLLFLIGSPSAYAHANLVKTSPPSGALVQTSPAQLTLTFSEELEPDLITLNLYDRMGDPIRNIPTPTIAKGQATQMIVPLPNLAVGTYTVVWSVVSEDGHPVSDTYTFSVGKDTGAVPPNDKPSESTAKLLNLGIVIFRYGVEGLLLIGAGLYGVAQLGKRYAMPALADLLGRKKQIAWVLLLLGSIAEWAIYSASLPHNSMTTALLNGQWKLVFQSHFATMVLDQVALLLLLALPSMISAWYGMIWLLLIGNLALGGHAFGVQPLGAALTTRILHLLTISAWIGALTYLLLTMLWQKRIDVQLDRTAFRQMFVRIASVASLLVVLTGIVMVFLQTRIASLLQSGYLWNSLLLLKIGLLVAMLLLALFQTMRWRRSDRDLSYNLLRFELLIGVLIIELGVWMSQIPYPAP